jgi:hypothetical protein
MMGFVRTAAVGIALFATFFLIYTGFYYIRSRGQEFGLYLTLGMTSKDLSKMVANENTLIFLGASALGGILSLQISYLLYLILGRILAMESLFEIGYEEFIFTYGILALIYLIQRAMTALFIKRKDITAIIQSKKIKDRVPSRPWVGFVSLSIFITSLFLLAQLTIGADWMIENQQFFDFMMTYGMYVIMGLAGLAVISFYFLLGSGISAIAALTKQFPRLDHQNILIYSGLSHKMRAYRTSLFSTTLLTGLTIFFVGLSLAFYSNIAINTPVEYRADALRSMGLMLFVSLLIGTLCLTSVFIVMYHKFTSDMQDEISTIQNLKRIGLTLKECRAYISKHLAIIFFLPIFLGGIPSLFLLTRLAIFGTMTFTEMWPHYRLILMMYGLVLLAVAGLYVSLRKNFIRAAQI